MQSKLQVVHVVGWAIYKIAMAMFGKIPVWLRTAHQQKLCNAIDAVQYRGRGLYSSTFLLNLSALYGIGGSRRGCVARVKGVLRGVQGVQGGLLCETRLKMS